MLKIFLKDWVSLVLILTIIQISVRLAKPAHLDFQVFRARKETKEPLDPREVPDCKDQEARNFWVFVLQIKPGAIVIYKFWDSTAETQHSDW